MKEVEYKILENREIARDVFRMVLDGETDAITAPGQFVDLSIPGRFLRRPISVCDWEKGKLTLIYKVVGHGTEDLSFMEAGGYLKALTGLGNGYSISRIPKDAVLAGGGVGVPPLYALAKLMTRAGKHPYVALGFNTKEDVFYVEEFRKLGVTVNAATVDGSFGAKGFVTDLIGPRKYAVCCGPEPMLRAVYQMVDGGQFSFEARMGCGFGACMGCSMKTTGGYKRVCADGPVFDYAEICFGEGDRG